MTKQSLKSLLKTTLPKSSLDAWLVRNVCNRTGQAAFDSLHDIAKHGCESGCVSELIYTSDCLKFYEKFEDKIWNVVEDHRQNTGQTLGQFLDSFSSPIEDEVTLKVKLSWFAVEESAHKLVCRSLPY